MTLALEHSADRAPRHSVERLFSHHRTTSWSRRIAAVRRTGLVSRYYFRL